MTYTKNTQRAIRKYGYDACLQALRLNEEVGQGARTIAQQFSLRNIRTTQAADAAINAGREIAKTA